LCTPGVWPVEFMYSDVWLLSCEFIYFVLLLSGISCARL